MKYGRTLGFSGEKTFLADLVQTLVAQLGDVFPELKERQKAITETLQREEDSFNQTLDRGLKLFDEVAAQLSGEKPGFPPEDAFKLYDTFGFPLDLHCPPLSRARAHSRRRSRRYLDERAAGALPLGAKIRNGYRSRY